MDLGPWPRSNPTTRLYLEVWMDKKSYVHVIDLYGPSPTRPSGAFYAESH